MKKIIYIFLFILPILLLSCSGSSNEAELKRQLDKTYQETVTKSQTEAPKAKSTETSKPKSDEAPKPKTDPDPKPKADPDPKPKTDPAPKPKTDPAPKPKTDPAPKPKTDPAPKPKKTIESTLEQSNQDKLMNEISLIIKQASMAGTLQELEPAKLCSEIHENEQYKCEQKVKMDIQSEMSKTSSHSQGNKDQHPKPDPNSKDPCASVPASAKTECEKGIADAKKDPGSASSYDAYKYTKSFDRNNPPKIAKYNITELNKFSRISKIRSGVGHNYTPDTIEYDPTNKNCKSMKHYLMPVGVPKDNLLYNKTPHTFKWLSIKYFAPVNGMIIGVSYKDNDYGTESNFKIVSTDDPGYYFGFFHVALLPGLKEGSVVTAGQQIGTFGDENTWGEIAVEVQTKDEYTNKAATYALSFLEVASDEVFQQFSERGVASAADVINTKEYRDANPLACDNSDAGWFIGSGRGGDKADPIFEKWQFESTDNWFFFK